MLNLTLTRVVFELNGRYIASAEVYNLTLTRVVFELIDEQGRFLQCEI